MLDLAWFVNVNNLLGFASDRSPFTAVHAELIALESWPETKP